MRRQQLFQPVTRRLAVADQQDAAGITVARLIEIQNIQRFQPQRIVGAVAVVGFRFGAAVTLAATDFAPTRSKALEA